MAHSCMPNVSVIIPAYNCEDLVAEAVASVREQTYRDFETIVVDDGSTDGTWEVIQQLGRDWPELQTMRVEHRGLAAARNAAIAKSTGQWIALLDSDDLWLPEKLARCMAFLDANPDLSIVYTPMAPIRMDGTPMQGHSKPCKSGWLAKALFQSIFVHDPASVFHKRVIETCGGFNEALPVCVGHDFWLRVSMKFAFGLIDEPLALRRWSETSLTRSRRSQGGMIKSRMLEEFYFEKGGSDIVDRPTAMKRLAKVHYHTGKNLLAEGRLRQAATYLKKASTFRPMWLKPYLYRLAALARAPLAKKRG
ncbi:MAG: glycosyltransferase [Phycisphaerae bacterium]|nr:glycosyltransferase [Phycisphaerae bacterium]